MVKVESSNEISMLVRLLPNFSAIQIPILVIATKADMVDDAQKKKNSKKILSIGEECTAHYKSIRTENIFIFPLQPSSVVQKKFVSIAMIRKVFQPVYLTASN